MTHSAAAPAAPGTMPCTPSLASLALMFDGYGPDGTMHNGGVIASVMDTAGAAAWSNHDVNRTRASTVSMSVRP
jgi:acyl-coenzyme A thioesterase PaaI-like protein